ncbi:MULTISPECIES: hypothetical protein [unclassified Microbacterium]|uniref:hypothetical protein n=1 Tax=unclassified Microbacterium TaxID=2609290 RepID=UPI003866BC2D
MKPWLVWVVGITLVVAAWGVGRLTPSDDAVQAPFVVTGSLDEEIVGREFTLTVTEVRRGATAVDQAGWYGDGNWVVVDIEAESRTTEQGTTLGHVVLLVDGATYRASERPTSISRGGLAVGLPRQGSVAFELPADAGTGTAVLQVAIDETETRLDSLVEVPFDLGALEPADEVELQATEWVLP